MPPSSPVPNARYVRQSLQTIHEDIEPNGGSIAQQPDTNEQYMRKGRSQGETQTLTEHLLWITTFDLRTDHRTSDIDENPLAIEEPHQPEPEQHIGQGIQQRGGRRAQPLPPGFIAVDVDPHLERDPRAIRL